MLFFVLDGMCSSTRTDLLELCECMHHRRSDGARHCNAGHVPIAFRSPAPRTAPAPRLPRGTREVPRAQRCCQTRHLHLRRQTMQHQRGGGDSCPHPDHLCIPGLGFARDAPTHQLPRLHLHPHPRRHQHQECCVRCRPSFLHAHLRWPRASCHPWPHQWAWRVGRVSQWCAGRPVCVWGGGEQEVIACMGGTTRPALLYTGGVTSLPRNRELREDRARETRDPDASSWNWKDKPYSLGLVSPAARAVNGKSQG